MYLLTRPPPRATPDYNQSFSLNIYAYVYLCNLYIYMYCVPWWKNDCIHMVIMHVGISFFLYMRVQVLLTILGTIITPLCSHIYQIYQLTIKPYTVDIIINNFIGNFLFSTCMKKFYKICIQNFYIIKLVNFCTHLLLKFL